MENSLIINNLSKSYNGVKALDDISLNIKQGDVLGLVGSNGAGKTTLLKIITGLINNFQGELKILPNSENNIDRALCGCLIENSSYHPNLSIEDNFLLHNDLLSERSSVKEVLRIISLVGLEEKKSTKVKNLSLGMKQRYGIGLALLGNPKLVILDEPTNGLDPIGVIDFRNIIRNLNNEYNTTFIISSHNLYEIDNIVNKFAILHKGRLLNLVEKSEDKGSTCIILEFEDKYIEKANMFFINNHFEVIRDNTYKYVINNIDEYEYVLDKLIKNNIYPKNFSYTNKSVESYYLENIKDFENE